CSPPWSGPVWESPPPPSPGPPSTTSTSVTPAAVTPMPTPKPPTASSSPEVPDEHGPVPDLVHDAASAHGVHQAARLRDHHADPAGDLAVPVRQPLQEGRRAGRLRHHHLPRLPGPGCGRDECPQLQHVGGHGH